MRKFKIVAEEKEALDFAKEILEDYARHKEVVGDMHLSSKYMKAVGIIDDMLDEVEVEY